LQEHESGHHLIQDFAEDEFAKQHIAPENGISRSNFFEKKQLNKLPQHINSDEESKHFSNGGKSI